MTNHRWKGPFVLAVSVAVLLAFVERGRWLSWLSSDGAARAAASGDVIYTCPMDPSVETPGPSQCPICGMALTPVKRSERTGLIFLDGEALRRIGAQFAAAELRTLRRRVVAYGPATKHDVPALAWSAEATLYGGDDAGLVVGAEVNAVAPALPLVVFAGTIAAVERETPEHDGHPGRPGRVRVDLADPSQSLRTGMTIELQLHVDSAERLAIPARAIIYAGSRRLVFVDRGKHGLELRALEIGARALDYVEVVHGLAPGDRVMTDGMFLAGAESRLRAASPLWHDEAPGGAASRAAQLDAVKRTTARALGELSLPMPGEGSNEGSNEDSNEGSNEGSGEAPTPTTGGAQ